MNRLSSEDSHSVQGRSGGCMAFCVGPSPRHVQVLSNQVVQLRNCGHLFTCKSMICAVHLSMSLGKCYWTALDGDFSETFGNWLTLVMCGSTAEAPCVTGTAVDLEAPQETGRANLIFHVFLLCSAWKLNWFVFLGQQLFFCVWWNRHPCWRREIVLKHEFSSSPLNSFWDVLVITVHTEDPPQWNPVFWEVSKCYISLRTPFRVLGLDVVDRITSVYHLLCYEEIIDWIGFFFFRVWVMVPSFPLNLGLFGVWVVEGLMVW